MQHSNNKLKKLEPKDIKYKEEDDYYLHHSLSHKETWYKVMPFRSSNTWSCQCPDFIHRGDPWNYKKYCKHIKRIIVLDQLNKRIDELCPQNKGLLH